MSKKYNMTKKQLRDYVAALNRIKAAQKLKREANDSEGLGE